MKDKNKPKVQLIEELEALRQRVTRLEEIETEYKQVKEKLQRDKEHLGQEAKDFLNTIIDAIPDPLFVKDDQHRWIILNDATCNLLGHPREDLFGKSDYDFLPKEQADVFWEKDNLVLTTGIEHENEEFISDASGNVRVISTKKALSKDPLGNKIIIGIIRDVTARVQAEEALQRAHDELEHRVEERTAELVETNAILKVEINERKQAQEAAVRRATELEEARRFLDSIIENIPIGLFVKDAQDLTFVHWNRANEALTGIDWKDAIGKTDYDFFPKQEADAFTLKDREVLAAGKLVDIPEESIQTAHKGTRILHTVKLPVYGVDGRPRYLLGISEDITERRKAQALLEDYHRTLEKEVAERTQKLSQALDDLKTTQKQLVEAEKMAALGGLVAGVAHEINTPIGIGVTAASLLEDKSIAFRNIYKSGQVKRSDLEKYLNIVEQSSGMILKNLSWAAELIQSFKQVAVDQSSEARREFGVKQYLDEILLSLRPHLKKTRHTIHITGDENLSLDSYPGVFSQIVTNLVMNSLIHAYEPDDAGQQHI